MPKYRNAVNNRESLLRRQDNVQEAGEIFTPPYVVKSICAKPAVRMLLEDPEKLILEPSVGDGNFLVELYRTRLTAITELNEEKALAALGNIWAVEIQKDNVSAARERGLEVVKEFGLKPKHFRSLVASRILSGSFLTGRSCSLKCRKDCHIHEMLPLPKKFALTIGNPPYNPGKMYQSFVEKSLETSSYQSFVLPTSWKLSAAHKKFRKTIANHIVSIDDLPWDTFAIKMRTCILDLTDEVKSENFLLNGEETTLQGEDLLLCNSILTKVYNTWEDNFYTYASKDEETFPVFIGWKCNLEKGKGKVNALQSIALSKTAKTLPNNYYSFNFPSDDVRKMFLSYTASKLAAYLQSLTDSDTVARSLPVPPAGTAAVTDEAYYTLIGLTPAEIAEVEAYSLFVSAKAKKIYAEENILVREDALVGKERNACEGCGSSSFHRKGCENSTLKEQELRDKNM